MLKSSSPSRDMFRLIFTLAWPTMLEELMQTAVQYIDTAMVGRLGTAATAAVGATTTVNWLIGSTISAIGVGFLAYISQAIGRGELQRARRASAQSVFIALMVGALFTALTLSLSGVIPRLMRAEEDIRELASRYFFILYTTILFRSASIIFGTVLRAAGDTRSPMLVGLAVNLTNVILNWFLIYPTRYIQSLKFTAHGAGLGVEGAAIASAVAYAIGGTIVTIILFKHKVISPKGESLKPDREVLRPCFKISLPNMVQRFATSLGYVAFASMINSLGKTAASAHTIANTVESAFYIPGWGMQTAAATIAGNAYGAGDDKKLRSLTRVSAVFEGCLMVVTGTLLFVFAPSLMRLFSNDGEVISLGGTVLRMVALSEPFYGLAIVFEGIMQGVGNTKIPFIFNVAGMWGVRILGTYIAITAFSQGLISAWGCMIAHNVLLFIMFTIYYITGRWKPKRISAPASPAAEPASPSVGENIPLSVGEAMPLSVGEPAPMSSTDTNSLSVDEATPMYVGEATPFITTESEHAHVFDSASPSGEELASADTELAKPSDEPIATICNEAVASSLDESTKDAVAENTSPDNE